MTGGVYLYIPLKWDKLIIQGTPTTYIYLPFPVPQLLYMYIYIFFVYSKVKTIRNGCVTLADLAYRNLDHNFQRDK